MKKKCDELECKPSLQEEVTKLKKAVAGYKGKVKSLQNRIIELAGESCADKNDALQLKRSLGDKDIQIDALQKRLDLMEQQNASMLDELNESKAMCTTYEAEINRYRSLPWYRKLFD